MTLSFKSIQQVILFVIILILLIIATTFELLPAVEQARTVFPKGLNNGYDCYDVLANRPWYGKLNYWTWLWILTPILLISFIRPIVPQWQKIILTLSAIGFCYIFLNLSIHLYWELRNAPFMNGEGIVRSGDELLSSKEDIFKFHCVNIADGASMGFALLLGWIPASLYVAFCFFVRRIFRNTDFTK